MNTGTIISADTRTWPPSGQQVLMRGEQEFVLIRVLIPNDIPKLIGEEWWSTPCVQFGPS